MSRKKGLQATVQAIARYFRATDASAQALNTIAATVLGNIPFYPLYAAWFVGARAWPTLLSFLSLPFFALVPTANRRNSRAGRWCLLAAGLVDTALCAFGLGSESGVELYYLPIALLPLVLYRDERWTTRLAMLALVAVIFGIGRFWPAGFEAYSPAEAKGLLWMHAVGVAALSLLILFLRWRLPTAARKAA